MLQENTTPKRRHAENVISESSPRTEKSWRLIVPLNIQELINLGLRVGCSYTAKCTHEHLTVAYISQTTSKKVATTVCKDCKTLYMSVEKTDHLKDFPQKTLQKPPGYQYNRLLPSKKLRLASKLVLQLGAV